MSSYKRNFVDGGTFFFTVVSYKRQKIFTSPSFRTALRKAIKKTQQQYPFEINAWVLLPNHIHCIWTLPNNDKDFSLRWAMIKNSVSQQCKYTLYNNALLTPSKIERNESTIWQRRFWEHTIKDESDYQKHLDYIYWNPVRHGHVSSVNEWPFSTFHRDVQAGLYDEGWGFDFKDNDGTNFGE